MHGVMYWSTTSADTVSSVVTWQDQRCTQDFLRSLPPSSPYPVSTGYACATTIWLARNGKGYLDKFDRAGNIMDYLGMMTPNLSA
jgi:sedoheptulokinase